MSKFTTPVSMKITLEQSTSLKSTLLILGYKPSYYPNWSQDAPWLCTGFGGDTYGFNEVSDGYVITNYNPTLFLAIAAMTKEKDGIAGEWWKTHQKTPAFRRDFYKAVKPINESGAFIDDYGKANGLYFSNHSIFSKPTKEELANYLKNHIDTPTIVGSSNPVFPFSASKSHSISPSPSLSPSTSKSPAEPECIYKVGDIVYFSIRYETAGKVTEINEDDDYPVVVEFNDDTVVEFTKDGKEVDEDILPSLSFSPYDLVKGGFSAERPKPVIAKGTVIYVWDEDSLEDADVRLRKFAYFDELGKACDEDDEFWENYSLENPFK